MTSMMSTDKSISIQAVYNVSELVMKWIKI